METAERDNETATLTDCVIHYKVSGMGPPVVLLHGWGASIFCWRFLSPLMLKKFKVYELDLPGFGRSTKTTTVRYGLDDQTRRVVEFMDQRNIESAYFVGSSMGGAISLWMGAKYPERVKAIVALAPAASRKILPASIHHFSQVGRMMPKFLKHSIGTYSLNQVLVKKELINDESLIGYLEPFVSEPNSFVTLLKAAEALRDHRLPNDLKYVQSPVKILYGAQDRLIKRRHIDDILEHLPPTTQIKIHPDAGHHPHEDEPNWVFEEILDFFK